jgi:hypothetical protein
VLKEEKRPNTRSSKGSKDALDAEAKDILDYAVNIK